MRVRPRPLDWAALGLCLLAIAGFSIAAYGGRAASGEIVIEASGSKWIYPLGTDRRELIPGPRGDTVVVIEGGKARVADSPCPDKLCVHMPAISRPGQWIACMPNRVFVRVRGKDEQTLDDVSF